MVIADKVVSFIGCGSLGSSMVRGLLASGHPPAKIIATCRDTNKLSQQLLDLQGQGVAVTSDNSQAITQSDITILCVRPSQMADLLEEVADAINKKNCIVISVVAGLKLETIARKLEAPLIRAMPNIAAALGEGVTLFQVMADTNKDAITDIAQQIFTPLGLAVPVENATEMDNLTPISGCGPAYFFYLVKILCDYGEEHGLPKDKVQQIAKQTIKGAVALLESSELSPEELINAVAVPNEKTATRQGLNYMQDKGMEDIVKQGAAQSEARVMEMGEEISSQVEGDK